MLQAFYRIGTGGVPSPADGDGDIPWWWDHLAAQARDLREVGFTAVWLPPVQKGASGTFSVGYDVYDDYDLGAKPQMGTKPTRYGTREQLARCVAMMRRNGLDVYLDLVANQRGGGINFRYRYRDARGGDGGRFPKDPLNFHPNVPQDPGVFGGPRIPELSFGDDMAIINAKPAGYVSKNLIAATAWATRALDVQGYRLDNAKGVSSQFVPHLLNAPGMAGKFAVGEFFDGLDNVQGWLEDTGYRAAAFDFPLRFTLARMCNQTGSFDMGGSLDHAGLAGRAPLNAVTFVENHDTDVRAELQPVITNKVLAYAYILTAEGYPCVFYRDYSTDRGCYGLKPFIDNLIWVHEKLADGPTVERWREVGLYAFERLGGPHLLVALNKDDWQSRTITVDTGFGPNVKLHDYTGHGPDTVTNWQGRATITVPRNRGGLGYACYSRDGQGFGFEINNHATTQELEGAPDLDIGPAPTDAPATVGRFWVEQGKTVSVKVAKLHREHFGPQSGVVVAVQSPGGEALGSRTFHQAGAAALQVHAKKRGWHTVTVQAVDTPAENRTPAFTLEVTYTSPATARPEELSAE
ncbi:MAG TPA: alpha-amylase family glycosyl hydrolase [Polyangia bacterium]|nr:alpha-amylase family glycosyl hydrolase [Polyangia bacterium]